MARLRSKRPLPLELDAWREVSRDMASGDSGQPQQPDRQVREILAHPRASAENLIDIRMNIGSAGLIVELIAHPRHQPARVVHYRLVHLRMHHPEQASELRAE